MTGQHILDEVKNEIIDWGTPDGKHYTVKR